jgi:hypothetical protein
MGIVCKARQVSLNRIVALKLILAGNLASEAEIKRFYGEAEAAANLDHPGIVPVYQVGQYEGQHFLSMGYVEGSSLGAWLAEGPLPPRKAAELVRLVAEAVQYAHRQGVIHRDLKPANILLDHARSSAGHRLWPGEARPRRERTDDGRPGPGDAVVHAAGAGVGKNRADQCHVGRLCVRSRVIRRAHGPPALSGGQLDGDTATRAATGAGETQAAAEATHARQSEQEAQQSLYYASVARAMRVWSRWDTPGGQVGLALGDIDVTFEQLELLTLDNGTCLLPTP